jgi:hypothetical protein
MLVGVYLIGKSIWGMLEAKNDRPSGLRGESWTGDPVRLDNLHEIYIETPSRYCHEQPFVAVGYLVKPKDSDSITLRIWEGDARDFRKYDIVTIRNYWFDLKGRVESATTDAEGWPIIRLGVGPTKISLPSPTPGWSPKRRATAPPVGTTSPTAAPAR